MINFVAQITEMKYTKNALNVLAARTFKGIGRAWFVKNWEKDLTDTAIVMRINQSLKGISPITISDFEQKRNSIVRLLEQNQQCIDGVVALGDSDFPQHRGNVKNSEQPIFLFYKGDLSLLSSANYNVAVIGLLTPTEEIENRERSVVADLVDRGATIVSGLALGCDTIAHQTTLDRGGKTVAILPSPLNSILPASNRSLALQILDKGGLLVSEYLTEAKGKMALSSRYQERDRLQALFSDAIILSASYAKNSQGLDSGSRLAMGYAADYGIPRAVIYDESESGNRMFDLNRQYIQEDLRVVAIGPLTQQVDLDRLRNLKPSGAIPSCQQKKIF